jgi:hypothetical protein
MKGVMIMKEELTNRKGSILTTVLVGGAVGAGLAGAEIGKRDQG